MIIRRVVLVAASLVLAAALLVGALLGSSGGEAGSTVAAAGTVAVEPASATGDAAVDVAALTATVDGIAAAAKRTGADTWVMAPMVATAAEAADFAARVRARGLVPGAMVEVPSAALLADRLLEHLDFLSIGTNDLSQYALAADRLSADLADLTDPWQPALLELVRLTAEAGRRTGKPVGVCGEAAADPLLAVVLVGLGATSLSCAATAIPAVGVRLGAVDLPTCGAAAAAALAAGDPRSGRAAVRAVVREASHPDG